MDDDEPEAIVYDNKGKHHSNNLSTPTTNTFGPIALFITMTCYVLIGAFIFRALENGDDHDDDNIYARNTMRIKNERNECLKELWTITERLNVLYEKNWTQLVNEQLHKFEKAVLKETERPLATTDNVERWNFTGALLYSLALLTTVGYGRLAPRTTLGKIVAMLYATIGVPLMLVLLSVLGGELATLLNRGYVATCHQWRRDTQKNVDDNMDYGCKKVFRCCNRHEESALIQLSSYRETMHDCQPSKRQTPLATVRATHAIGRCAPSSDIEESDDVDDHNTAHNTPSRIPLIWHREMALHRTNSPPPPPTSSANQQRHDNDVAPIMPSAIPSVPAICIPPLLLALYLIAGVFLLNTIDDWPLTDAIYFCFVVLSTIGVETRANTPPSHAVLICFYLIIGLIILATCFNLMHARINHTHRCRHNHISSNTEQPFLLYKQ